MIDRLIFSNSAAGKRLSEILQEVEQKTPALFCVGFIPPGGLSARRHLSKLLHARFPELTVVVGHWGLHEKVHNDRETLLATGATHVTATLIETRAQIAQAMHPPTSNSSPSRLANFTVQREG